MPQPPPATTITMAAAAVALTHAASARKGHANIRPRRGAVRNAACTRVSSPSGEGSAAISHRVSSPVPDLSKLEPVPGLDWLIELFELGFIDFPPLLPRLFRPRDPR